MLLKNWLPVSNEYISWIEFDLLYLSIKDQTIVDIVSNRLYLIAMIEACNETLFPKNKCLEN